MKSVFEKKLPPGGYFCRFKWGLEKSGETGSLAHGRKKEVSRLREMTSGTGV
jgi:hypothetical protein